MEIEFISSVIKLTIFVAITCFIASLFYHDPFFTSGIAVGACWGAINLFLTKHLLQSIITQESKDYVKVYVIACIKFPLLYLLGFVILNTGYFPTTSMVLGFSLIFVVIFLKGLVQVVAKKVESI